MQIQAKKGRKKRTWVRIDCHGILHGSNNYIFTLEEQAVFIKLICMAAQYGITPGIISDNDGKPLPKEFMAYELHCSIAVLDNVIKVGAEYQSIKENSHGLEIINFNKYQFTEYDRQKPYRQAKKQSDDPDKFTKGKYGHMVQQ